MIATLVLAAFAPQANAFELFKLSFNDSPQVSVADNGGFWISGYHDAATCKFTLRRGKAKIPVHVVKTTDVDREFSHANYLLRPSTTLGIGAPYYLRFTCGRYPPLILHHGIQQVAFHGTGEEDLIPPEWESMPVNIEQTPLCPICGQSTMEFSTRFRLPVTDLSPLRIHATFWRSDNSEPPFSVPMISGRFDVEKYGNDLAWQMVPGVCYQLSFCATDFAGNQSCTTPQPFVREVASCWADTEVISDSVLVTREEIENWCRAPAPPQLHRAPVSAQEGEQAHLQFLLLSLCAFLLILLRRRRRAHRAKTRLGQF